MKYVICIGLVILVMVLAITTPKNNIKSLGVQHEKNAQVTITGAVMNPGTYMLNKPSMTLRQLIEHAGGLKEDAQSLLPFDSIIIDGDYIVIPYQKEVELISINYATCEELSTLPGIGPALANRIIAYRSENGNFEYLEEVMHIKGIKEKLFAKIKAYITL